MGDRPHDAPPADDAGSRPARPRPPARTRPAARRPAAAGAGSRPPASGTARRATATTGRRAATRAPRSATRSGGRTARPAGDGAPAAPAAPPATGSPRRGGPSQNTLVVLLSVLTVVVVGFVVWALVLRPAATPGTSTGSGGPTTTADPEAPGTTLPDTAFDTFTSDRDGFSIKYPKDWAFLPVGDEGGLALDAGGGDAVDIRLMQRTEVPTTAENLENIKAFTDGIIGSNKTAVILKVQPILVNGMPGYYYLYTFTEPETGGEGAHAHYFLFRGRNMYTLVFQAFPSEGFTRLSKVFDQMAASFQTTPDTGPAPEATTTVPAG